MRDAREISRHRRSAEGPAGRRPLRSGSECNDEYVRTLSRPQVARRMPRTRGFHVRPSADIGWALAAARSAGSTAAPSALGHARPGLSALSPRGRRVGWSGVAALPGLLVSCLSPAIANESAGFPCRISVRALGAVRVMRRCRQSPYCLLADASTVSVNSCSAGTPGDVYAWTEQRPWEQASHLHCTVGALPRMDIWTTY